MGRPPTAVGTHGAITRVEVTPGRWRARTRFRDLDGRPRLVEASGSSGAAAERALRVALRDRATPSGREITGEMRIAQVGALWFEELELEGRLRAQSIDTYRAVWVKHIEPAIGQLRVREASVSRVDGLVKAIAVRTPGQAKHVKVVLAGVLGLAVRHDALPTNPVRSIARQAPTHRSVKTVDLALLAAVRSAARGYRQDRDEDGRLPRGPRPDGTLPDAIDLLLATGARIGEVLALRWAEDVDLGSDPTVTIAGTIVSVRGQGLTRQPIPKTSSSYRTLRIPRFAVDVLLRRRVEATGTNPRGLVFPTRRGTPMAPRNVARSWRAVRVEAGLETVTLRAFRRTVATLLASELGAAIASSQLGHAGEAVTSAFYIAKPDLAPDSTAVLDRLGPAGVLDG